MKTLSTKNCKTVKICPECSGHRFRMGGMGDEMIRTPCHTCQASLEYLSEPVLIKRIRLLTNMLMRKNPSEGAMHTCLFSLNKSLKSLEKLTTG